MTEPADPAPLVLTVAPNGARAGRHDHPALPLDPAALAATARACLDAGAAVLHLHVRDANDRHSLDAGRYREALAAVRAAAVHLACRLLDLAGDAVRVEAVGG